jgi:hypothetical protein
VVRVYSAESSHVSVLCARVRDLGRVEWSRRRCTGFTFERISIFPT